MPLDHIALYVQEEKLEALVSWFNAAFKPLHCHELFRPQPQLVAFGDDKTPWFWIFGDAKLNEQSASAWRQPHLGFVANDANAVGAWHEAAIKAGGTDNGEPGPRPMFGPTYYAAFVKDPVLGINFEAVCKTWAPPADGDAEGEVKGDAKSDAGADAKEEAAAGENAKAEGGSGTKHKRAASKAEDEKPASKKGKRSS